MNHLIVIRELLTLQSVQLTWVEPEDNNARINSYNITFCPSVNGTCEQTLIQMSVSTETVTLSQLAPVTTYQVYIHAENDVGQGPEPAEPYLFDSANRGVLSVHLVLHSSLNVASTPFQYQCKKLSIPISMHVVLHSSINACNSPFQ